MSGCRRFATVSVGISNGKRPVNITSELLLILLLAVGPVALAVGFVLWLNLRPRRKAAPGFPMLRLTPM